MTIQFKEIEKKKEELMEQGSEAQSNVTTCKARVSQAQSNLASAIQELDRASQTDEEGNPVGDIRAAQARVNMTQNQLAASEKAFNEAQKNLESVNEKKKGLASDIAVHNDIEKSNLDKLKALKKRAFADSSNTLTEGIAERLNEAEDARAELLASLGINEGAQRFSGGGAGGGVQTWGSVSLVEIDTSSAALDSRTSGNSEGVGGPLPLAVDNMVEEELEIGTTGEASVPFLGKKSESEESTSSREDEAGEKEPKQTTTEEEEPETETAEEPKVLEGNIAPKSEVAETGKDIESVEIDPEQMTADERVIYSEEVETEQVNTKNHSDAGNLKVKPTAFENAVDVAKIIKTSIGVITSIDNPEKLGSNIEKSVNILSDSLKIIKDNSNTDEHPVIDSIISASKEFSGPKYVKTLAGSDLSDRPFVSTETAPIYESAPNEVQDVISSVTRFSNSAEKLVTSYTGLYTPMDVAITAINVVNVVKDGLGVLDEYGSYLESINYFDPSIFGKAAIKVHELYDRLDSISGRKETKGANLTDKNKQEEIGKLERILHNAKKLLEFL